MSIITLTDRISVSVRAKNNTEKSAQNKATGANIQKALGGSGLSDADLEGIGNVNSITDENGNEWIKMEDIIAAGRKMKEKGAFNATSIYDVSPTKCFFRTSTFVAKRVTGRDSYNLLTFSGDFYVSIATYMSNNKQMYRFAACTESKDIKGTVTEQSFTNDVPTGTATTSETSGLETSSCSEVNPNIALSSYCDSDEIRRELRNGLQPSSTSGGSIIDWDAPNAEVERQIKNLHETWDVTEHPGASGQGVGAGTYILAGPIEFNDGD